MYEQDQTPVTTDTSFLDAAVELARSGLAVLPLRPNRKTPRFVRSFHDATTVESVIVAHWRQFPLDNIGVRPSPGVGVLDVDPRNEGDLALSHLENEHGPLPATWTAQTGSGGWHYWFLLDGIELRGKICNGLDLKHGGTGYVVAPPSIHPDGGSYWWLTPPFGIPAPAPAWLRKLAARPEPPPPAPGTYTASAVGGHGQFTASCLVARIAKASEGDRNRTLYGAARDAFKQGDLDAYEADLVAAATLAGLDSREIAATIRSAKRGPA